MPGALVIAVDDPRAPDVHALLERHLAFAYGETPPGLVYALDADGLSDPAVTFFAGRVDGTVVGVVALKALGDGHAEIKSMHTAAAARGSGVGTALLDHVLAVARERGVTRVSLETGTNDSFAAARRLYERAGFAPCPPFGGYPESEHSVCMTLVLARDG